MSDAKVELFDVALKGCASAALNMSHKSSATNIVIATRCEFANNEQGAIIHGSLTSAKFNNCVFHDNSGDGIFVNSKATAHLHGEATAIHSNEHYGIYAYLGNVVIHLPSHHNTSYNNGEEDRYTSRGGTITNVED